LVQRFIYQNDAIVGVSCQPGRALRRRGVVNSVSFSVSLVQLLNTFVDLASYFINQCYKDQPRFRAAAKRGARQPDKLVDFDTSRFLTIIFKDLYSVERERPLECLSIKLDYINKYLFILYKGAKQKVALDPVMFLDKMMQDMEDEFEDPSGNRQFDGKDWLNIRDEGDQAYQ